MKYANDSSLHDNPNDTVYYIYYQCLHDNDEDGGMYNSDWSSQ